MHNLSKSNITRNSIVNKSSLNLPEAIYNENKT